MSVCVENVVKAPVSSFCQDSLSWITTERNIERKREDGLQVLLNEAPVDDHWLDDEGSLRKREKPFFSLFFFTSSSSYAWITPAFMLFMVTITVSLFFGRNSQEVYERKNRNESRSEKRSLTGVKHEIRHEVSMGRDRRRSQETTKQRERESKQIMWKLMAHVHQSFLKGRGRSSFV